MPGKTIRRLGSGRPRWVSMLTGLSFAFAAVGYLIAHEQRRRTRVALRNSYLAAPVAVRRPVRRFWVWWADRLVDPWGIYRVKVTGGAVGDVLEIGVGRWPNLTRFGAVTRLVGVERDRRGVFAARRRVRRFRPTAEIIHAAPEALPFPDASFDTVVVCLALCSVRDQVATLREIARVLRPGGTLRFLEHVRAENPTLAALQTWLEPLWRIGAGGCHPDRATLDTIRALGFTIEAVETTGGGWWLARPTLFGVAKPPTITTITISFPTREAV